MIQSEGYPGDREERGATLEEDGRRLMESRRI